MGKELDMQNGEVVDADNPNACKGCGREVTLFGNGYCGMCQDDAPEDGVK